MPTTSNKVLSFTTRSLAGFLLILIALGIFTYLFQTRPEPATSTSVTEAQGVQVFEAEPVLVGRQWRGFGTATAMDSADVPARVTATVVEISDRFLAGAHVREGEVLVRLDESDFARQVEINSEAVANIEIQLEQLKIEEQSLSDRHALEVEDLKLAQAESDRAKTLFGRNAANQRDLDQARRAVLTARRTLTMTDEAIQMLEPRRRRLETERTAQISNLRLAKQNLQRCVIVSPLNGVLQSADVKVGENLFSGQRVARVVNLDRIEVALRLPAAARSSVAVGDSVKLESTNRTKTTWTAQIARIAPDDDQATRTFAVYVAPAPGIIPATGIPGTSGRAATLAPGRFVAGTVTGKSSDRYVVPKRSFQGSQVQFVESGQLVRREVQVDYLVEQTFPRFGLPDLHWAVLDTKLTKGDLVVVKPSSAFEDFENVEPVLPSGVQPTAMRSGGK